jgi:hypothetical protein
MATLDEIRLQQLLQPFENQNTGIKNGILMAKVAAYVPEPKQEYDVENQRQILEAIATLKSELIFHIKMI